MSFTGNNQYINGLFVTFTQTNLLTKATMNKLFTSVFTILSVATTGMAQVKNGGGVGKDTGGATFSGIDLVSIVIGLVIGLIIGYLLGKRSSRA